MQDAIKCRWMIRSDMKTVMDIEDECFEHPWRLEAFAGTLRKRSIIGMVAERAQEVVGFMVYELHKHHVEVLNFAVMPVVWRTGVGTAMLDKLKGKLSQTKRRKLLLVVRENNLRAHRFLKAGGFRATEVLHGFYDETEEDAYVFEFTHEAAASAERPVEITA